MIDTSCLIDLKNVPLAHHWALFRQLEAMVEDGTIAMPRQVIREITAIAFPDVPGAWAKGVESKLQHPLEADYEIVGEVMDVAGEVIEDVSASDPADPYVLALALQLQRDRNDVTVVTEDDVDRLPLKISMATACKRLKLARRETAQFLRAIEGTRLPSK